MKNNLQNKIILVSTVFLVASMCHAQSEYDEFNQEMEALQQMLDPEKGMFSGMLNSPTLKKNDQVRTLDKKIDSIISEHNDSKKFLTTLKLQSISWAPIGDKQIDSEMKIYYEEKISKLVDLINQSN